LAVRALRELAGITSLVKAADLAQRLGTTSGFVPQALAPLVRSGWVRSEPGPTGGYALDAELESISVLDVIEAIEGPTDTGRCVLAERVCGESGECALHAAWSTARAELLAQLGRIPVADASMFELDRTLRARRLRT
jgi:Rrf2 family protein